MSKMPKQSVRQSKVSTKASEMTEPGKEPVAGVEGLRADLRNERASPRAGFAGVIDTVPSVAHKLAPQGPKRR